MKQTSKSHSKESKKITQKDCLAYVSQHIEVENDLEELVVKESVNRYLSFMKDKDYLINLDGVLRYVVRGLQMHRDKDPSPLFLVRARNGAIKSSILKGDMIA